VFSKSCLADAALGLALIACGGCAGPQAATDPIAAPQVFYTVTGEIARQRHEPRLAALQYKDAAVAGTDLDLLAHASEVTTESLQPSLTAVVAARWISLDPTSPEAHRAAARAALSMQKIPQAAEEYRIEISTSPRGVEAEFADLDNELSNAGNLFGARQVADRLAAAFPQSAAALRLQGFAALRADDPAAAAKSLAAALDLTPNESSDARREITMGLWRARILSGDSAGPLADAQALAERETTPANLLDYALLLLAAQQNDAAITELETLEGQTDTQPVALRLLGLIEFQENKLDAASRRFTDLLATGKFLDDSFYYLGLIAERRGEPEKALRLYAQVQGGDNAVGALLRASNILQTHGAAPAAEELLDHLLEDEPQRAPEVLAARARFYADSGDVQQAIEVLDRGAAEYPDNVDIRYAIASTYEEQGRVKAALRELKDVLKARPDDPAALNAYGYTLADHNRELARARTLIERAYAAAPKNAAILDSLGWVLYRQGHGEQALPYLSAAYADDRGADIGAHLGEVLWQLGRRADAEQIWTEASAGDSDNRALNATRQRLHSAK
jgi:tetratricopeptide (TPR) repeat protein